MAGARHAASPPHLRVLPLLCPAARPCKASDGGSCGTTKWINVDQRAGCFPPEKIHLLVGRKQSPPRRRQIRQPLSGKRLSIDIRSKGQQTQTHTTVLSFSPSPTAPTTKKRGNNTWCASRINHGPSRRWGTRSRISRQKGNRPAQKAAPGRLLSVVVAWNPLFNSPNRSETRTVPRETSAAAVCRFPLAYHKRSEQRADLDARVRQHHQKRHGKTFPKPPTSYFTKGCGLTREIGPLYDVFKRESKTTFFDACHPSLPGVSLWLG